MKQIAIARIALFVIALAALSAGCKKDGGPAQGPQPQAVPPAGAPGGAPGTAMQAPPAALSVTGEVLETMDAASYTYVRLKTADGKEVWAAGPQTKVAVGEQLVARDAMEMQDFESSSLGRKFDTILFASALAKPGEPGAAGGPHGAMGGAMGGAPHGGMGGAMAGGEPKGHMAVDKQQVTAVPRAEGEQGRTVAEVHAQAGELAGKPVAVRGVVVKSSPGIMGRNWLHIQDATGDPAAGTHDLTITTQDKASPGDRVKIEGTVAKDRDFGAGYKYPVIVEDAKVSVEL